MFSLPVLLNKHLGPGLRVVLCEMTGLVGLGGSDGGSGAFFGVAGGGLVFFC